MDERETTRQTLDHAATLLEDTARYVDGMREYMNQSLALFQRDPPDTDFQRGYLEGLKVFANEAMGFKWDDPLLWGKAERASEIVVRPKPTLVVQ